MSSPKTTHRVSVQASQQSPQPGPKDRGSTGTRLGVPIADRTRADRARGSHNHPTATHQHPLPLTGVLNFIRFSPENSAGDQTPNLTIQPRHPTRDRLLQAFFAENLALPVIDRLTRAAPTVTTNIRRKTAVFCDRLVSLIAWTLYSDVAKPRGGNTWTVTRGGRPGAGPAW